MKNLRTWDIETTDWNIFNLAVVYDGERFYTCYSIDDIIKTMTYLKGVFYAHFAGGFDNLFLLGYFKDYSIRFKNIGSRLTKISVYYKNTTKKIFELRDSYPILPAPLDRLGKEFLGRGKQNINRKQIQRYSKQRIEEYCKDDCKILFDVLTTYLNRLDKKNIKLTIASEAYNEFKSTFDIKQIEIPKRYDPFLRRSYSGGRVEVFKRYGTNLNHYDFKSAYPSVMLEEDFPSGLCVDTDRFMHGYFGVYECEVVSPNNLHIPFLHTYDATGKIIYPLGTWRGVYTSIEINKARSLGYYFFIKKGYYFTQKVKPFKEYVSKWYNEKLNAEKMNDTSMRYIAKLYLNSLYGKLGQRREFDAILYKDHSLGWYFEKYKELKDYNKELNIVIVSQPTLSRFTSVHIASFITAYVRIRLYELIERAQSVGGTVYYCDTDCVITDADLKTGKKLGDIDTENDAPITEGVFISPKFYSYKMSDGTEHTRIKGLSDTYTFNDFKHALNSGDYSRFKEKRDGLASLLECNRRHLKHLSVLEKERQATGIFTKRELCENHETKPLLIGSSRFL